MSTLSLIKTAIEQSEDAVQLVCIDGPAGAGKTYLSETLLEHFPQACVVHMDDLYDGWINALDDGLTHRLNSWILEPLQRHQPLMIQKYDWASGSFGTPSELAYGDLVILEGVGSAQTIAREVASTTIFIDVKPEEGKKRVLERDGESVAPFLSEWQIQEAKHHKKHATRESCDIVLRANWWMD
mgnify:CR=1 FL=1